MPLEDGQEPVEILEDADTGDRFLVYGTAQGVELELRFDAAEPWFSQSQLAQIFGVSVPSVNEHIGRFLADGELDEAVIRNFRITASDGKSYAVKHYGLDVAFYVGYRVNSREGVLFRRWATQVLTRFATKGFLVHTRRLKDAENFDRIKQLREIIAEIRASDVNLYGELGQICSFCQDYDPKSQTWRDFYARMRAKLYWAVTSQTPSMLMAERANSDAPNMGLQSWAAEDIRQSDALSAASYLSEREFRELNSVTVILLDVFADQAELGRLTTMAAAESLFEKQLKLLGRSILTHGGNVSRAAADDRAKSEYQKFDAKRKAEHLFTELDALKELKNQAKDLPKTRKVKPKSAKS
ncbi:MULTISPECIES: RhuM family protein [Rhodomicrobium]|uniref:RhuM family protein n=1 Tax=Rhodomicrobium TaxID=1068 RepID=UPI000B4B2945|nr:MULTISPECIES: RhuM family protein [Rhodomicrobium]